MKSRYEAEAQRRCAEGVAVYLQGKHKQSITQGFVTGTGVGLVCTAGLYVYNYTTQQSVESNLIYALPAFLGMLAGTVYGIQTADVTDSEHTDDFNAVCDELAKAEEEEEEEEEND